MKFFPPHIPFVMIIIVTLFVVPAVYLLLARDHH